MGDSALMVEPADAGAATVSALAESIRSALARHRAVDVIPSYSSLLVRYDPTDLAAGRIEAIVRGIRVAPFERATRHFLVPVAYGGSLSPDLDDVAALSGMSTQEVIHRYCSARYTIRCIGFSPGFPYLDGLDPSLHTPRLETPRPRVPAGSVAIGGSQTGIYPFETPGGWRILGRTPLRLFDPALDPPVPYRPGDTIEFTSITWEEFERLSGLPVRSGEEKSW